MNLSKAIIHELIKEPARDDKPAVTPKIDDAKSLLDCTDKATISLIESIQSLYGTKGNASSQGVFSSEEEYRFPKQFAHFLTTNKNKENFVQLTMNAMRNLVFWSDKKPFATGGYMVFASYEQNGEDFFIAAMVKKKDGIRLVNLKPETIQEVDLSKLHQAVRLNIGKYKEAIKAEKEGKPVKSAFLSFISPKSSQAASGYFINAFGCTDALPAQTSTNNAIKSVKDFFDADERLKPLKNEANDKVVEFLEEVLKTEEKLCTIDSINGLVTSLLPAELVEELQDDYVAFANDEPYNVPDSFYIHSGEVNKAKKVRLRGLGGAWTFTFEKRLFGDSSSDDVQFNKAAKSLTLHNLSVNMIEELDRVIKDRETDE
jgi:nucleoid-associated protein